LRDVGCEPSHWVHLWTLISTLPFLAEAKMRVGAADAALATILDARTWPTATAFRSSMPKFFVARADARHALDADADVTALLQQALQIALTQGALSFELRAARSLARLLASQGDAKGAIDVLAPVYERFTEGFDARDLREAKELLQSLA
jgi:hypothetical protein